MTNVDQNTLLEAYRAFNARDIDGVLALLHPGVHWPNGWEGGYVEGHAAVRDYWTRQWKELNPKVVPVSFLQIEDGRIAVSVQQTVKDLQDNLVFDGLIKHIYTLTDGLINSMEIENLPPDTP